MIRDQEKAQIDALTQSIGALGGDPAGEATYDFGQSEAASFLGVAMALEAIKQDTENATLRTARVGYHAPRR